MILIFSPDAKSIWHLFRRESQLCRKIAEKRDGCYKIVSLNTCMTPNHLAYWGKSIGGSIPTTKQRRDREMYTIKSGRMTRRAATLSEACATAKEMVFGGRREADVRRDGEYVPCYLVARIGWDETGTDLVREFFPVPGAGRVVGCYDNNDKFQGYHGADGIVGFDGLSEIAQRAVEAVHMATA